LRVVILCPRREGYADRDALWSFTRPWWTTTYPDWPLIEGYHEGGLFNRSAAVNNAAALAGDWDVALVIDSDVLADEGNVRKAVEMADQQGNMVVPFELRHNLNARGTRAILRGDRNDWHPHIHRTFVDQHSSVIAIPRRLWDATGGFDEGFAGWGLEDTAFAIACEMFSRPLSRISGEAWHLHHSANKAEKHGSPSHQANMARCARYRAALSLGDRDTVRSLVEEGRRMSADRSTGTIPQILHRVVPERTPDRAEEWWQRFRLMHPGWRMMTHRDPLDPGDWPISSPSWRRVKAGAQLADLVRLEALLRFGGIYVDMDVEPFRPLDALLPLSLFAAWEDDRVIPNAIMGARPEHPAIRECLTRALRAMNRSVWDAGPGVTTLVLPKYPDALLLPPGMFYDVDYRDPDRDAKMERAPAPWTLARHHYWGSWLPEERRRVPA
jgi:hypothetical protein